MRLARNAKTDWKISRFGKREFSVAVPDRDAKPLPGGGRNLGVHQQINDAVVVRASIKKQSARQCVGRTFLSVGLKAYSHASGGVSTPSLCGIGRTDMSVLPNLVSNVQRL